MQKLKQKIKLTACKNKITRFLLQRSHWNASDCIKIQEQPNFNSTLCKLNSTSNPIDGLRLDIRLFINNKLTIRGIFLTMDQCTCNQSIKQHIATVMHRAITY